MSTRSHAEEPSHSLNNTLQMETHGCLVGRLIIGVVWLQAEASWLHFLTLISEKRVWPSSRRSTESAGSLLSRPFTSFIILGLYFTLIPGFSASVCFNAFHPPSCPPTPVHPPQPTPIWEKKKKEKRLNLPEADNRRNCKLMQQS